MRTGKRWNFRKGIRVRLIHSSLKKGNLWNFRKRISVLFIHSSLKTGNLEISVKQYGCDLYTEVWVPCLLAYFPAPRVEGWICEWQNMHRNRQIFTCTRYFGRNFLDLAHFRLFCTFWHFWPFSTKIDIWDHFRPKSTFETVFDQNRHFEHFWPISTKIDIFG